MEEKTLRQKNEAAARAIAADRVRQHFFRARRIGFQERRGAGELEMRLRELARARIANAISGGCRFSKSARRCFAIAERSVHERGVDENIGGDRITRDRPSGFARNVE